MKMLKALVCLIALTAILAGGLTMVSARKVEASRCCWVMVCTTSPPFYCWEVCKTCPKL
jgi:hypothetical protein